MELEVVKLGASKLNESTNSPQWQAINEVGPDPGDSEPFGDIDVFQGLGVSAMPWPADDNSNAEGIIVRNCGNRNAICIGARDTRTSACYGNMRAGDTVLHSTGPNQAAQVQCKEEKRQVVLFTRDSSNKGMIVMVDGKNEQIQINAFGMLLQMKKGEGITINNGEGASIIMQGPDLFLQGNVHIAGINPGMFLQTAPGPSPGGPASLPTIPVLGVGN